MTLFFNGKLKKLLILALNKEGACISVSKDARYIKKAVLVLKVCREEGISEHVESNFAFIELSKSILEQMHVICKVIF